MTPDVDCTRRKFLCMSAAAAAAWVVPGCGTGHPYRYLTDPSLQTLQKERVPAAPPAKFIVFSDPHYFDPSLGTGGKALNDYLIRDRKMLVESREILDAAVEEMCAVDADFVLIAGDLTKDGERVCHEKMKQYCDMLKKSGKQVFVVPGNHDILNAEAYRYHGEDKTRVETVTPGRFEKIFSDHGFSAAIHRDSASLSYVAQPVPGLWLLALDSCLYRENPPDGHPVTNGAFSSRTKAWIEQILISATEQNMFVVACLHHNLMEHFDTQQKYFAEYIVDEYQETAEMMARYNVRLAFTGHFHSHDITLKKAGSRFVMDIETGSLVTYPCPWRIVSISEDQTVTLNSRFVRAIPSVENDLGTYAKNHYMTHMQWVIKNRLRELKVPEKDAQKLAPQLAAAFKAHAGGDERAELPPGIIDTQGTGLYTKIVAATRKRMVKGLWTDKPPGDHSLTINLKGAGIM